MKLIDAIEEFLIYYSSVRGMSKNSTAAYKNDLLIFLNMPSIKGKNLEDIQENDVRLCISELSKKKRKATSINRFISAVRVLFAYCRKFDYIKINPTTEIKNVKIPKTLPRFMTGVEVDRICEEPKKNPLLWALRDYAIFEMLYSSGCRLSELVNLKIGDFSVDLSSAKVKGKGKKDRIVYFGEDSVNALKSYLLDRKKRFKIETSYDKNDFIFVNQKGTPLTSRGVGFILSKYSSVEGTKRHVNPHAFRHTFATALISSGADVRLVQELLGHSSISTTQRYTHISTEKMIEMYNKSHPHGGNKS